MQKPRVDALLCVERSLRATEHFMQQWKHCGTLLQWASRPAKWRTQHTADRKNMIYLDCSNRNAVINIAGWVQWKMWKSAYKIMCDCCRIAVISMHKSHTRLQKCNVITHYSIFIIFVRNFYFHVNGNCSHDVTQWSAELLHTVT